MNLPGLHGKMFAITGTTSGTGYECAKAILSHGGNVLALNRPSERATKALLSLNLVGKEHSTTAQHVECDLSSFQSVAAACKEVKIQCSGVLYALVCNAGIMAFPDQRTVDGYDIQMQ